MVVHQESTCPQWQAVTDLAVGSEYASLTLDSVVVRPVQAAQRCQGSEPITSAFLSLKVGQCPMSVWDLNIYVNSASLTQWVQLPKARQPKDVRGASPLQQLSRTVTESKSGSHVGSLTGQHHGSCLPESIGCTHSLPLSKLATEI